MKITKVDGLLFEKMVRNGLANLKIHEEQINEMNVFPVTDGDTGTNMLLTLEHGINHATETKHLGVYLRQLSEGMLLGARGNSGVILSQIFKGFYDELESDSIANVGELKDAFIRGYQTAYKSVTRPVEGTILTVAREGIENIKSQIGRGILVPNLFSMYLAEMRKTLALTTEMLPALKEANVVDSGGYGYVLLVEGMEKSLYGEEIKADDRVRDTLSTQVPAYTFSGDSIFELGYCMEFLMQLIEGRKRFNIDDYIKNLGPMGESLVAVQNGDIIKVHIHTKKPAGIIEYSQEFGEFISFKLENMQLQHDELMEKAESKKTMQHKPIAIIAISNGEGLTELFESFECDVIIDGGKTMNTSAEEMLDAIKSLSADKILLYPNHENIFKAAEQAVLMSGQDNVIIMPSNNAVECYSSFAMDIRDDSDMENRILSLKEGCKAMETVLVTQCAKDCVSNGVECVKGEYVVIKEGRAISCVASYYDVTKVLKEISALDGKENCIIFTGQDIDNLDEDKLVSAFYEESPGVDVSLVSGQQRIYDLMIGLM